MGYIGKAVGAEPPKHVGVQQHVPWMLNIELQNIMCALLGFSFALGKSFLGILFISFIMGLFTLCHSTLGVCNFFLKLHVLTPKSLP